MATPRRKTIICDVEALSCPDLDTVNVLARLALTVRRLGLELRLVHASRELRELLVLMGLFDVLAVEPVREAKEGEQLVRVEEERHLDDPAG
jgi:anti-anti-sigma regulatory factor